MDRPTKEWIARTGQVYGPCAAWQGDLRRWRIMHSQMVWQAMQAVLSFVIAVEANRAQLEVVENHSGFSFNGESADLFFNWECFMRNGGWDVNHG